jgi:hypothetical protein
LLDVHRRLVHNPPRWDRAEREAEVAAQGLQLGDRPDMQSHVRRADVFTNYPSNIAPPNGVTPTHLAGPSLAQRVTPAGASTRSKKRSRSKKHGGNKVGDAGGCRRARGQSIQSKASTSADTAADTATQDGAESVVSVQTAPAVPDAPAVCGLPIGAGPEGVCHMPPWETCALRQHRLTRRRSLSF